MRGHGGEGRASVARGGACLVGPVRVLGELLEQRDGLQGASESCARRDQASRATRGLGGWRQLNNSYKVGWLVG